nr:PREDICTED: X-ray repair cross-complementing protein 6 [Lepisosteus oculatus]
MAEWDDYYRHEGEEEAEQEEGEESGGDYKFSGRDSLVFLVDASKEMLVESEDDITPFEMTLQCVRSVYTSKIISSDRDLVALVFYGTAKHKNSVSFKHVYVYHDLESPGARRVQELDRLQGERGRQLAKEELGCSPDFSLGEALWACSNLFSDVKLRLSHKRLMIFTNQDDPHGGDRTRDRLARTKAADLKETGEGGWGAMLGPRGSGSGPRMCCLCGVRTFFPRSHSLVISSALPPLKCHPEEIGSLSDCTGRSLETLDPRIPLSLGEGVSLAVGVYVLARTATKPPAVRLYRDTNEPVRTKTRLYHAHTGSLLLPSDTKRSQTYRDRQIVLENEEVAELKKFEEPGLVLIGFKPLDRLKRHHHIRPALFIYPEEQQVTGSSKLFTALLKRCSERGVFAVCRYTPRRNTPPQPKLDVMDQRLGVLAQEFKELVYPPDYNPEGKGPAQKRKPEGGGGAEKKARVEVSEEGLRAHLEKGTLGKLTVPVLKDACQQLGVRTTGTKKQELIDALTKHYSC